jgi:hypothetical protein
MSPRVGARLVLACVVLASPIRAAAQPLPGPPTVVGALIAISCAGSDDGIPTPWLSCDRADEGAPGPYVRPYVSVRPLDRLLLTAQVGYLRMPGFETRYGGGVGAVPPLTLVRPPRTAWHAHGTVAYLGGEPAHPVRTFVGGGLSYFDDPIRHEFRPAPPPGVNDGLSWQRRSGWDQVVTAGILFRVSRRLEGRASYLLAGQLTTPTHSDGAWRHEIGVGLGWRVR